MKNRTKRLKLFLLYSAVTLILAKLILSLFMIPVRIDERVYLPVVFTEAQKFSEKKLSPKVYEALDSYDEVSGYCFNTYDTAPHVKGYAGPIELLVGMKVSGEITGVSLISHNETSIYMQKLIDDKFLDRLRYKKVRDDFILDKDIDGVTHATVSANAIARSMKQSAVTIANEHLGMNIHQDGEGRVSKKEVTQTAILLLIMITSVVLFLTKKSNTFVSLQKRDSLITGFRDILLIAVLFFVGFYKSSPISITNIINVFYLRLPDLNNIFFYTLIGGFFVVSILFGRLYCGYLCPFSALIEFVEKIRKKKNRVYDRDLVVIKYIFLWAIIILVIYFNKIEISSFEPYLALFSSNRNIFMWISLVMIFIFTLFYKRIWCRYFCCVGAFLAIIAPFSPFRTRPPGSCDSCGACARVCPMEIEVKKNPDSSFYEECIGCQKCHEFCIKSNQS